MDLLDIFQQQSEDVFEKENKEASFAGIPFSCEIDSEIPNEQDLDFLTPSDIDELKELISEKNKDPCSLEIGGKSYCEQGFVQQEQVNSRHTISADPNLSYEQRTSNCNEDLFLCDAFEGGNFSPTIFHPQLNVTINNVRVTNVSTSNNFLDVTIENISILYSNRISYFIKLDRPQNPTELISCQLSHEDGNALETIREDGYYEKMMDDKKSMTLVVADEKHVCFRLSFPSRVNTWCMKKKFQLKILLKGQVLKESPPFEVIAYRKTGNKRRKQSIDIAKTSKRQCKRIESELPILESLPPLIFYAPYLQNLGYPLNGSYPKDESNTAHFCS